MDNTEDHFSLKWNNFRSSLTEGFHDFLREEMMVDVTLAVEGKFLQAHKLVLSVCSPYFKNLFNVTPCKHPIVILKDVSHNELSNVLQFMYKGEVGVKHEELPSFLKLADTLKLKGLAGIKIENESDSTSSQDCSTVTRLRKKKGNEFIDLDVENLDSDSSVNRLKELRCARQRKRRFSNPVKSDGNRSAQSKKMRGGKSNMQYQLEDSGDDDYPVVDENNSVVKLIIDNENNKREEGIEEHSHGDVFDSEDLEGKTSQDECDLSTSLYGGSGEATQAPQAFGKKGWRHSPIWNFFVVESTFVICKTCGKKLKGVKSTNAESHLSCIHADLFAQFTVERRKWRREKSRRLSFLFPQKCGVDYQMIQTKRGKDMLLYDGYTFTQNRMCKDGMRWQCSYHKCKAFCRMSSAGWLTPHKTNHDHPKPPQDDIKKRILRMELKARAQSSGATPGEIIRNALPAEEYQTTNQRACYTRCIQRFRKSLQRKCRKPREEVWIADAGVEGLDKDSVKSGESSEEVTCTASKFHGAFPLLPKEGLKEEPLWSGQGEATRLSDSGSRLPAPQHKIEGRSKVGTYAV